MKIAPEKKRQSKDCSIEKDNEYKHHGETPDLVVPLRTVFDTRITYTYKYKLSMTSTSQTDDDERSKMPQTNKEENELESPAPPSFPNYNHTTLSSPRPSRQRRLRRNSSVHKVGSKPQQQEASISAVDAALADLQALLENDNDESLTPEKQQQTGSVHSSPSTLSNTSGASHSPAQIRHVPVKRAMAFSEPPPAKRQNHPPKVAKSKQSIVGTR